MTVFNRFTSAILLLATATCSFALGAVGRPENSCRSSEFWWQDNQCCLPHGGPPSFPSPPPGNDCPSSGWYWFEEQSCCVPQFPNPPPPSCDSGWVWDSKKCCPPPPPPAPKPSGHGHWKKAQVSRANSLCPFGLDACPVSNSINNDYECLDTTQELESCGGCASIGQGQDCTAIPGVWNVGCESGTCAVYSCAAGYRRASDDRSCVAL